MVLILKIIGSAAIVYIGLLALMFILQGRLLFVPDTRKFSQNDVGVSGFNEITVTTEDGLKLDGWYAAASGNKPTIAFFHGNASTYQWRAPDFVPLVRQGYGVLLAGYRGYGGNPGAPSEAGFYKDAEAWLKFLPVPRKNIVVYGESLGTGVAVEMAARHADLGGIILEAPYSSISEVAAFHYPFVAFIDFLTRNKFDSVSKIERVAQPKLFMLAKNDRVVPAMFGHKLFDSAADPKTLKIYDAAEHSTIRKSGGIEAVADFLATLR